MMLNVLLEQSRECVPSILRFFRPVGGLLLDISYGKGQLVSCLGSEWLVVGGDRIGKPASIQEDWGHLPFRSSVADVVIFDPPWMREDNMEMAGLSSDWSKDHSVSSSGLDYSPPFAEALRVLKRGGLLITKIQNTRKEGRFIQNDLHAREALQLVEGLEIKELFVHVKSVGGIWRMKSTPHQCYGFFIVAEKSRGEAGYG